MVRLLLLAALSVAAFAQSTPVLSQEQVQQLEQKASESPAGSSAQTTLGRNYGFAILGITALSQYDLVSGFDPANAKSGFADYARKQLEASGAATVVAEAGQVLWNYSTRVESYAVMNRMAGEYPVAEMRALAAACIDRAIALQPENARWRSYRIPILVWRANFTAFLPLSAADAYGQVKEDLKALRGPSRSSVLPSVAQLAVKASALEDADGYARELLDSAKDSRNWNHGNAVFFGNMVLGQVAARRGSLADARAFLLASAKGPGSPQLNSFGPNMALAKDLIEAGEGQAVLEFFTLCRGFWKNDQGKLERWAGQVKDGRVPDFGANLIY